MLSLIPIALDNGNQNTEKPYAIPIHKWIAKAVGGIYQRLNLRPAIVCRLSKKSRWWLNINNPS